MIINLLLQNFKTKRKKIVLFMDLMGNLHPIKDVVTGKTSIHLRCLDQVKRGIERFLSDRKVQILDRERIVKEILGSEYRGTK